MEGNAGAFSNSSLTASSGASRWMKSPIKATALRATSGLKSAAVATRAIKLSIFTLLRRPERTSGADCLALGPPGIKGRSNHTRPRRSVRRGRLPNASAHKSRAGELAFTAPHHRHSHVFFTYVNDC